MSLKRGWEGYVCARDIVANSGERRGGRQAASLSHNDGEGRYCPAVTTMVRFDVFLPVADRGDDTVEPPLSHFSDLFFSITVLLINSSKLFSPSPLFQKKKKNPTTIGDTFVNAVLTRYLCFLNYVKLY